MMWHTAEARPAPLASGAELGQVTERLGPARFHLSLALPCTSATGGILLGFGFLY